jgi:outer membrane protein
MHRDHLERPAPQHTLFSIPARLLGGRRGALAIRSAPWLVAIALGVATLTSPAPAAAQSKVAIIDVRRAVLETEEGLRVQATLKKLFDSRQVELETKQRALTEEQQKIEKEERAGKTPKDAIQRRKETLERQGAEFQATYIDYQREMQRKETELTTPILQRVMGIIRRLAAQEGYEMVVEKAAVPYFRADLEVTDRVIQLYNSGQTGEAPAKGAPAAPAKPAPAAPKKK